MWPNPEETADLVTFTEETLNGKLHFLYSVRSDFVRIRMTDGSLPTPCCISLK